MDAARRELYEETGVTHAQLEPLFDYALDGAFGRAAGQGLLAALLASALLFALLNAVAKSFPQIFEIFSLGLLARCAVILALAGILVCAICARAVTRRLVRMDQNELYG